MNSYNFTILLSASVPSEKRNDKYLKIKDAQIQIEEAVIGLSRNVFQSGGRLLFGGHPSISPLVAMVASEFHLNKEIENLGRQEKSAKSITIYQSRAFESVLPDSTTSLFNLGYAEIVWTEAINGETFKSEVSNSPQCKKSLDLMRERMIKSENIDALVCLGGMEGVEEEFQLFRDYKADKPIYILESTGGASRVLSEKYSEFETVKVIDKNNNFNFTPERKEEEDIFTLIPYSFYTALIVDDLLHRKEV